MTRFTADELTDFGYINYVEFENGRNAAITRFMFTSAILTDLTAVGYGDRYCYADMTECRAALKAFNGEGHPEGWHRHLSPRKPDRRVCKDGIFYWGDADPFTLKQAYGGEIPPHFLYDGWQDDDPTNYLKHAR